MKRGLLSLSLCLFAVAAPGAARQRPLPGHAYANPSAVIAAEIAFAQLAQDKGQWTAFRATAAPGAKMFQPQPVLVSQFLGNRADPATTVKWQPHEVWMSCDGSYAVTRGAWQRPEVTGYFITVWQRQKDGGYKWVLDQGEGLVQPLPAPDMIRARVADCPERRRGSPPVRPASAPNPRGKGTPLPPPIDPLSAASDDGTLRWTTTVDSAGAREFSLVLTIDGHSGEVLHASVKAPGRV
ncbi:MAG: hypothetical protein KGL44_06055 [Sphingomonadales bacterium]|nr:hypothetical protein [Sphingomonadales bacterium]